MKFGNASWGFRETPIKKQLEITSSMGLNLLELGIANAPNDLPLEASDEEIIQAKKLYEKYGIELLCAATGNDFSNGSGDDVDKINKVIDICEKLEVTYLRIFAGFSPAADVTGNRWDTMISSLKDVYEYAKKKKVVLAIETHGGVNAYDDGVEHFHSVTTQLTALLNLLNELPQAKMNYDPANLYAVGIEKPETVCELIRDRICCVHLKDFVRLPSGHLKPSACGESDMDWKSILKSLEGFDGPVLFEYENTEDIEDGCKRCLDFIKKEIDQ